MPSLAAMDHWLDARAAGGGGPPSSKRKKIPSCLFTAAADAAVAREEAPKTKAGGKHDERVDEDEEDAELCRHGPLARCAHCCW